MRVVNLHGNSCVSLITQILFAMQYERFYFRI